jgi:hypothetical protein
VADDFPRWRVPPVLPVLKLGGAALLLVAGLLLAGSDRLALPLGMAAAAALAVWAARDLAAGDRLAADADGLTVVVGFAGRRRIPWSQVERVGVDRRSRRGVRAEQLEVDTGEAIHVFTRWDLGVAPQDAFDALRAARPDLPTDPLR